MIKKKSEAVEIVESVETELYAKVRGYIAKARAKVYAVANKEMVLAYWNVGREIVEKQGGEARAKYGDGLIKGLSMKLTAEFGPGYTVANLRNMRQFFLAFEKRYTLCSELGWSHFRLLMHIENLQSNTISIFRQKRSCRLNCSANARPLRRRFCCLAKGSC